MMYTERAPRRQQIHVRGTSPVTTKRRCKYTASVDIRAVTGYSRSFRIVCDNSAMSLLEQREQRYIKAMNIIQYNYGCLVVYALKRGQAV